MKDKYLPLIEKVIFLLLLTLAFLLPTFFLPVTIEFFEFNKLALTIGAVLAIITLWALKMIIEGKVEITKSPINTPLLLVVASFVISTWLSINKFSSIYGSYGRWNNSLVSIIACTLLYFAASSNLKSKEKVKTILGSLILGTTITSALSTLSLLGLKFGNLAFAQARNFTLTGSTITTSAFAAVAIILSLGFFVESQNKKVKAAAVAAVLINFIDLALLSTLPGWVLLISGVVAFLALTPAEKVKNTGRVLYIFMGMVLVVGAIIATPALRNFFSVSFDYPREIKLDLKSSWTVATASLRDFPFFGSGPSTFYLDFSHYRPLSLNASDNWAIRFDKPFNEYLDILSTLGVIGLLVYLWLIYKTVVLAKFTDGTPMNAAISSALISMFLFYFFHHSAFSLNALLFLLIALLVAYSEGNFAHSIVSGMVETAVISFSISGKSTNVTTKTVAVIFAVPMLLIAGVGSFFGFRAYAAEVLMRQAVASAQRNDASSFFNSQRRAIAMNPYLDTYHTSFAQTNFILANSLAGSKKPEELNDDDRRNIQNLLSVSVQESRIATELLNPTSPANWELRGRLYSLLRGVAKDSSTWAIGAYARAIELDPTNPLLRLALGGVYFADKDFANAERHFRAAASIKPDFANAHYNLAQALKEQGRFQDAYTQMQVVVRLMPKESKDYEKANGELSALSAMPEVAGAQTSQPSVSELGKGQGATGGQPPLTEPGVTREPTLRESTSSLVPSNR